MLVLSRKANETIQVGGNITITILKSKGNTVRLGIDAPREVRVMRGEVLARDEATGTDSTKTIAIDIETAPASAASSGKTGEAVSDAEAACATNLILGTRCGSESFQDVGENTRCADRFDGDRSRCEGDVGYEGDCWSVSSMKRRVRKVVASRK